jgi:RNA polymerase sigma-70 factor (ECF subfamily)
MDDVEILVGRHRELLEFVQRRVGDRALAEDILQDALVKRLDHADEIRESSVGWMYRVLRNAIIDHARRRAAEARRVETMAREAEARDDPDLRDAICGCVSELATTLKAEYADALQRIDIDGISVKDYAATAGITATNAGVRVFRAREALRKQVVRSCGTCAEHGCVDCSCRV